MKKSRTAQYYAKNPKARKKRVAQQARINARPQEKERRRKLIAERRKRGINGKGGKDISHMKNGKTTLESPRKNRARNGHGGRPKRK